MNEAQYRILYRQSIDNPQQFWTEQACRYLDWIQPWDTVLQGDFRDVDQPSPPTPLLQVGEGSNKDDPLLPAGEGSNKDDPLPLAGEGNSKQPSSQAGEEKIKPSAHSIAFIRWFEGGLLNASTNCIDRHLPNRAQQPAIIWEGNEPTQSKIITYQQLLNHVCQLAHVLKNRGVQKGDRVCIYMPMIPEAMIAMLACTRMGAIHTVVFAGFSAASLKTRLLDAECGVLITADGYYRGDKYTPLKQQADDALQDCPKVHTVVVVEHAKTPVQWQTGRDLHYLDETATAPTVYPPEPMSALDPLFILYTSGSTGKPKGVLHGTAGYLLYAAMTHHLVFDYRDQEIYWCTADIGWITGHTYLVYGPLANGATTLVFEGTPQYPDPSRFWQIIDKHQVNIFYTAPTAIRALRREGDKWLNTTQRSSLRILGSVGEPINPDVWLWYYEVVGKNRCTIVDTWWQTETGGVMITPFPGVTPTIPGAAGWPFFGVVPHIVDQTGNPVPQGTHGELVIKNPWPGMLQTIYNNPERFIQAYFKPVPGYYFTGDTAFQDPSGQFHILGRNDDVIKVSGHRLSTAEIESALISHQAVSEAAVIGIPDPIKGECICACIGVQLGIVPDDTLKHALIEQVKIKIGAIAAPAVIYWVQDLPKTRSGKIMRRILKCIAGGETESFGDLSTLANPQVLDTLRTELTQL